MNHVVYKLTELLNQYRHEPYIELELRLGWKTARRFDTNIGKTYSDQFYHMLDSTPFARTDENSDVFVHKNVRVVRTATDTVCQKKRKIETHDILLHGTPFDLRISVCQELPAPFPREPHEFVRSRARTTWKYKLWSYDLTHARSAQPRDETEDTLDSYEFELEVDLIEANRSKVPSQYIAHSTVMKLFDLVYAMPQDESAITKIEPVETLKNNLKKTPARKHISTHTNPPSKNSTNQINNEPNST